MDWILFVHLLGVCVNRVKHEKINLHIVPVGSAFYL